MKKILLFFVLTVSAVTLIQGQTKTVSPVTKYQKSNPVSLSPPPATTSGTPDLTIVSLSITKISSNPDVAGLTKYTFDISYTIKNAGNISIDAKSVDVSGTIINTEAKVPKPIAGCGNNLPALAGEKIDPGATYGGSYRCYDVSLENSIHFKYILKVDGNNKIAELNEQNNSAQISFLF